MSNTRTGVDVTLFCQKDVYYLGHNKIHLREHDTK